MRRYKRIRCAKNKYDLDLIEFINLLNDKDILVGEFSQFPSVGIKLMDEVKYKMQILKHYFDSKKIAKQDDDKTINNDISNDDLEGLYKQLEYLLHQHQILSEQILILQNKIAEIGNK